MASKRLSDGSSLKNTYKMSRGAASVAIPSAPSVGTVTVSGLSASVPFTANALGALATSYTATSSPGNFTGSSASSPITVSGLTGNVSYTFTVTATNANGTSAASSSSNAVTPSDPSIPLLSSWSLGASIPSADRNAYWGWNLIGGTTPRVYHTGVGRGTDVYYNDGRGGTWTTTGGLPVGGLLGGSSKTLTNSNRFYAYGNDSPSNGCWSTANGSTWRTENNVTYAAAWACGSFMQTGSSYYLFAVGDYALGGQNASRGTVASDGTVSWSSYSSYPIYKAAGNAQALTSKLVVMGGYTSGLASIVDTVYSTTGSGSWVSETSLPFSAGSPTGFQLRGQTDSRIYVINGGTVYSRGDTSGTWRSETGIPSGSPNGGWGTVDSSGVKYIQTDTGYYQLVS
jgi:hypothetical protein